MTYHERVMTCYVVGDIHGCLAELRYLIEQLPLEHGDRLIFLGDYIDRGPRFHGCSVLPLGTSEASERRSSFS